MADESLTSGLSIGEKLKALRVKREKSIDELAQEVNLTSVVISQIERGTTTPPVGILAKLASAFHVSVGYFFDEDVSEVKVEVVRAHQRKRIDRGLSHRKGTLSYAYESLAFRKSDKNMEPFLVEFDIDVEEEVLPLSHDGEEFFFVLEGKVEVNMKGETILLERGDSLYFDSQVPHAFRGIGHEKAKALVVFHAHTK